MPWREPEHTAANVDFDFGRQTARSKLAAVKGSHSGQVARTLMRGVRARAHFERRGAIYCTTGQYHSRSQWRMIQVMPIFTYFAITGPALLVLLLALNAYLEPEKVPSPTELLAIGTANANSGPTAPGIAADEKSQFLRLKQIPIKAIKGPS